VAATGSGISGLASSYATALYALADEGKALDQTADDLRGLKTALGESEDLRRLVRSPLLSRDVQGEVTAQVTAAVALTDRQTEALVDQLKKTMGAKVQVNVKIDPALLGGMIVKVGSRMVDSSLRTKLAKLQLAMKGTV